MALVLMASNLKNNHVLKRAVMKERETKILKRELDVRE
jgi:hypothetical protein